MSISQSSLDIRLQKLICCIGNLAGEVANQLFIGGCFEEKLRQLKILIGYLEALECYSIDEEEIFANGTIILSGLSIADEINILINGTSISGIYTVPPDLSINNLEEIISLINSVQSSYIAEFVTGDHITPDHILITGLCSNDILSGTISGIGSIITTGLSGGHCSLNCLTEDQVLNMFEKVSEYCDICFPSSDYQFTNSLIS